jgi:hypothetical protein
MRISTPRVAQLRRWLTVAGTLLALLVPLLASGCTAKPPRLLMYGDSIALESQRQLQAHGVEVRAFGGTAICDWLDDMRRTAATGTVTTVYLEFVGNRFTPCASTRSAVDAYRDDAREAVAIWHDAGARVVWVRAPQPRVDVGTAPEPAPEAKAQTDALTAAAATSAVPTHSTLHGALITAARQAVATNDIAAGFDQVQDAAASAGPDAVVDTSPLISPGRTFSQYVPCRAGEACGVMAPPGYNAARSPDGLHLCPTMSHSSNGVVVPQCSVWSTSAQRFADEVTATS